MARVSRKNIKQNTTTIKYKVGIYTRLSKEDAITGSDSIENQIQMLKKYILKKEDLVYQKTYIDNGFSGTSFHRHAFNNLLEDIKNGIINTVAVKDLSRFGRNYIESGHYLEKIFPNIGVRFIAVNDNFDSINIKDNQELEIALKSIVHDSYAKDISRKISTALDAKKRSGKFLGKYAPYGYKKSAQNKYVLEINEETKDVIKMIFDLRLKGMGVTAIAHKLNNQNIPSQNRYLWEKGLRGSKDKEEKALWRGSSVKSILENPNYIGALVVRKYDTALYKGRQKNKKQLENIEIIKNTHMPIIDKETFNAVQNMAKKGSDKTIKKCKSNENILRGMITCGLCGGKLQRDAGYKKVNSKDKSYNLYCPKKYIKDGGCSYGGIKEDKLKSIILNNIQLQIKILHDEKMDKETYLNSSSYKSKISLIETKKRKLLSEINKVKRLKEDTYKDYKIGLLSASEYEFISKKYEKEYCLLSKQLEELEINKGSLFKSLDNVAVHDTICFQEETELTRQMLESLIHDVIVTDDKVIIKYKFMDEYKSFLGV
ncbi:MAG: recombinase family protein [Vallitalea sp.]|jgi:DNA invertase Pin-like site-specific DNA recombinase|nr:recombinase family protein [Vallitalea sp.]